MVRRREGWIEKRPSGAWQVRWYIGREKGPDGKRGKRRYGCRTVKGSKRDAERELRRILRARDTGEYIEPSRETLDTYLDQWLDTAAQRLAPRTLESYRWLLAKYVRPALGWRRIGDVRHADVQDMINKLACEVGPRTVRLAHAVLSAALKAAVKRGELARNPAALVDLPRAERIEMHALSEPEVARLREALAGTQHAGLFDFLLGTGCRPGEALAVRWKDVDLDAARLTITRSLTKAKGRPVFKSPKTAGSRRSLPLPGGLVTTLRAHKRAQAKRALKAGAAYDRAADLTFANEVGHPLDLRNLANRHLKPALKRAGLPSSVRLYDLRHTHCTLLLARGVHPKVAAERLGHATTRQTLDTYSHVLPGMQEEAIAKLEGLFG